MERWDGEERVGEEGAGLGAVTVLMSDGDRRRGSIGNVRGSLEEQLASVGRRYRELLKQKKEAWEWEVGMLSRV